MSGRLLQEENRFAHDEIDLFELIQNLWRRKYFIGLCAMLGVFLALGYSFIAQEKWTSSSYISQPRVSHILEYLEQRRTLARADDNHTVDRAALANSLFGEFLRQASSEVNKRAFFEDSAYIAALPANQSLEDAARLIEDAVEQLSIETPDEESINPYYTFTYTATSAQGAQSVLSSYLAYANNLAIRIYDDEFRDALNASILARRTERDLIERELLTKRENWIGELKAALDTARAAGVENYMGGRTVTGNVIVELAERQRLFMLGQTYLDAELKTAQESPIIYPVRYHEIEKQLAVLEPLLDYPVTEVQTYRYQLEPTLPLRRDSPNRSLLGALGATLGGMIGVFGALILSAAGRRTQSLPEWKTVEPELLASLERDARRMG